MQALNLTTSESAVEPPPKQPGLAFLLSLLVPGAGHLYCGKTARGALVLFVAGLCVLILFLTPERARSSDLMLADAALAVILFLYVFSFLDAFFTAREINSGVDKYMRRNPRVAATLSLLSNGLLGYVYVGRKRRGIAAFFLLGFLSAVGRLSQHQPTFPWLSLATLALTFIPVVDAYRLAKQDGRAELRVTSAPPSGLTPYVPVGLAILIGFLLLLGYVLFLFFPQGLAGE